MCDNDSYWKGGEDGKVFHKFQKMSEWLIQNKMSWRPNKFIEKLYENNIEARRIYKPLHLQSIFKGYDFISIYDGKKSISEDIYSRGICLPSDINMTTNEQEEVIRTIRKVILSLKLNI